MKDSRISTYLFLGLVLIIALNSHGQCPSVGCTTTINGPDAGTYTVLSGQKLCLATGADFTGTVNMNGGIFENCASAMQTFTWNFLVGPHGTINNYGDLASNLTISTTDADIYNYGTITVNASNNFHINGDCQIYNYGTVTSSNNIKASDVAYIYNEGTMNCSNQFHMNGTSTIDNHGTINGVNFKNSHDMYNAGTMNLTGSYSAPGTGTTTFDGGCMSTPTWTNSKPLVGLACGTIDISGYSENQSSVSGIIAIVDATPPGAPPYVDTNTGSFGPGVQWTGCGCAGPAIPEICGNGIDDNGDGRIDEDLPGGVADNLLLWLRADVGFTGATWEDQSPNSNDATSFGDPVQVANSLNFNPGINFDGNDHVEAPLPELVFDNGTHHAVIFCVYKPSTASTNIGVFGAQGGTNDISLYDNWLATGNGLFPPPGAFGTNPHLVTYVIDEENNVGVAANSSHYYHNGNTGTPFTFDETNAGSVNSQFHIGKSGSSGFSLYFQGDIHEIIIYYEGDGTVSITDAERQKIESYLATKYGISLSHNFVDSQ